MEAGRGDEVDIAGMAYDAPLGTECHHWRWRSFFRLAELHGRDPLAADKEIWAATFIPYARAPIATAFGASLFGDIGIGVSGLSHTQINMERKFSTGFQFSEILGFTLELGGASPTSLSLRLQHISNGGIKHPNDGVTFASLVYSVPF